MQRPKLVGNPVPSCFLSFLDRVECCIAAVPHEDSPLAAVANRAHDRKFPAPFEFLLLRDGIAFEALQAWMRGRRLGTDTLHAMRGRLLAMLAAPADAAGFAQPFAALVLAELARVDRLKPWLSTEERDALVDAAVEMADDVADDEEWDDVEEDWEDA